MGIIRRRSSAPDAAAKPFPKGFPKRYQSLTAALGADHALGRQSLDLGRGVTELGEHLTGVLAECGWNAALPGLLRDSRIGEATPLYQSFSTTSPR